jgi:lysyl-tRNA synthetase class 2
VLATIRAFFAERGVLEVETPLLAAGTIPEPAIESLHTHLGGDPSGQPRKLYLQTSPEFAMKRLLAAGSGPIYQLCKSFRDGESGRRHNPEFTLLEWYRPGFDHHALMAEVDELVRRALSTPPAETITYGALFERHLGLDPFAAPIERLCQAGTNGGLGALPDLDRDGLLNLLMAAVIEPRLAHQRPLFVHDFPASQAALAKVRPGPPPVAERFELFVHTAATGTVELANGFHELADPAEQRRRFESDRSRRRAAGQGDVEPDARFLAALDHGLPACAGVALGVDRLVMLASGASRIEEVLAFPIDRA